MITSRWGFTRKRIILLSGIIVLVSAGLLARRPIKLAVLGFLQLGDPIRPVLAIYHMEISGDSYVILNADGPVVIGRGGITTAMHSLGWKECDRAGAGGYWHKDSVALQVEYESFTRDYGTVKSEGRYPLSEKLWEHCIEQ